MQYKIQFVLYFFCQNKNAETLINTKKNTVQNTVCTVLLRNAVQKLK